MKLHVLYITFVIAGFTNANRNCQTRSIDNQSVVCVCNKSYCDYLDDPKKISNSRFLVYTSNRAGLRFRQTSGSFTSSELYTHAIQIDRLVKYQKMQGWGGAFTDSTGYNIDSLSDKTQEHLLNSYFGPGGIGYNLGRIPIGGTDFSLRAYSYNDGAFDRELNNFKLQPEDFKYKLPFLKRALELRNHDLKFFAAAWSAPLWMKTDHSYKGFLGMIRFSMYDIWANYHIKFIEKYQDEGIPIWKLSTGNEPVFSFAIKTANISRIAWIPMQQALWLGEHLGPALAQTFPSIKVMILDDQRFLLPWFGTIAISNYTDKYIDSIAVHWYLDNEFSPEILTKTHDMWPDKFLLATEASFAGQTPPVLLGSWDRGERYSKNIIQDCSNWVTGWVDWNMALDVNGGPTFESNYLDAPIIVNSVEGEFYKQPMFYHIGHFSKFVPSGSVRIFSNLDYTQKFETIAFERPDKGIAVIILNRSFQTIPVSIFDTVRGVAKITVSASSITTVVYW